MEQRSRTWRHAAVLLGLVAASYATSLAVPFMTGDDAYYVASSFFRTQRPGLAGFWNVWSLDDLWRSGLYAGKIIEFFPLRDTVYWGLWQLFGPSELAFHVTSLLAHAATVWLLFLLAQRLGFSRQVAFWGSALFATHPVHVESVTWISGLKDPMFAALMMGSLLSYAVYLERKRPVHYALFLLLMIASLLVKSVALVTPLLAFSMERLQRPVDWRGAVARLCGPTIVSAGFFVQFVLVGRAAEVITAPHGGSWGSHAFLSAWALVRYVQQALIPATFSVRYCFRPLAGPFDWRLLAIALLPVLIIAAWTFGRSRSPRIPFLLEWFFICLLPVSNIVPFPALMADRYLYASTVATCLLTAWAVLLAPPRVRTAALTAFVAIFGVVTAARGVVWWSEADLWREAAAESACHEDPDPAASLVLLSYAMAEEEPRAKFDAYTNAFHHPGFASWKHDFSCGHLAMGSSAALGVGEVSVALRWATEATRRCPEFTDAWEALRVAATLTNPQLALEASRRGYRVAHEPRWLWRVGVSRFAAGDVGGADDAAEAVVGDPALLCDVLRRWVRHRSPPSSAALIRAQQVCRISSAPAETK